jgi:hypothetical protein
VKMVQLKEIKQENRSSLKNEEIENLPTQKLRKSYKKGVCRYIC